MLVLRGHSGEVILRDCFPHRFQLMAVVFRRFASTFGEDMDCLFPVRSALQFAPGLFLLNEIQGKCLVRDIYWNLLVPWGQKVTLRNLGSCWGPSTRLPSCQRDTLGLHHACFHQFYMFHGIKSARLINHMPRHVPHHTTVGAPPPVAKRTMCLF